MNGIDGDVNMMNAIIAVILILKWYHGETFKENT